MQALIDILDHAATALDAAERFLQALLLLGPWLVATCSVVTATLPKPEGSGWWARLYPVLNRFALNVGHAENRDS